MLPHLLDHLHLSVEACCTAFHQGHVGSQTHAIHMATSVQVVEGIEDNVESFKPINVELGILDVRMVGFKLCVGPEFTSDLLRDLHEGSRLVRPRQSTTEVIHIPGPLAFLYAHDEIRIGD